MTEIEASLPFRTVTLCMFCFYQHLVLFVYEVHIHFRNLKVRVFWRGVSLFFLRNLGSKKSFSVDDLCFLVPWFVLLCMCVFSFLTPRFGSTTAKSSLWLPYSLRLLCVCFCSTLGIGRPIFAVLRYANLFLSKFVTALNNGVIVCWWQCAIFYIIVL